MNSAEFRRRFPGLDTLTHLASCSQGAPSDRLLAELAEYQHTLVEHGSAWDRWMVKVQRARELFAARIGAGVDDVAVVASASEGAYQVASTQAWSTRTGLVTTEMEFPSIAHVWLAQQARGAKVAFAPEHDWVQGADDYATLIGPDTGLVSAPLISYRNGLRLPVRARPEVLPSTRRWSDPAVRGEHRDVVDRDRVG